MAYPCYHILQQAVALFTRAWIEIDILEKALQNYFVALFTRAWIEIDMNYS